ncbi:MAG: hypothetical protein MET45_20740 [Nostoc sp. LLA-1]|nr:hypothetical protein [Cyanocohniella sp. LLY]
MLGFLASTQPTRSGDWTTRLGDVYDGLRLRITFKTVSTKIAIALLRTNIARSLTIIHGRSHLYEKNSTLINLYI